MPSPDSDGPTAASEPRRKELSRRAFFLGAAGVGVAAGGIASTAILLTRGAAQQPMPTPTPTASPVTVAALLAERPFRVAHRGGSDDWPEMSLYAYQQSIAHGYQALEMSVARSADGVWFGLHDATLDRTSGTIGFTAADHFWSEISTRRISAKGTHDPGQPAQPYLQLRRFLTEFGRDFVLFVDPKAADPSFYPELLDLIHATVPAATRHVIAKSGGGNVTWGRLAAARGHRTWGFYTQHQIEDGLLAASAAAWDLLGVDVTAPDSAWMTVRGYGKPVLGSVIHTEADQQRVLAHGAVGEVVADVVGVPSVRP